MPSPPDGFAERFSPYRPTAPRGGGLGVDPRAYTRSGRALSPASIGSRLRNQGRYDMAGIYANANAPSATTADLTRDRLAEERRAGLVFALNNFWRF